MTDVVVLRQKIHGLDPVDYADAIRERLPEAEVALARTPSEERELLMEATVATGFRIDPETVAASDSLDLFVCTFAGTDHLPLDALEDAGVTVANASGVHGPNIAEQVLGYVLADVRNLRQGWTQNERGEWNHYQGGELAGSTATVVGMGPIGETIIDRFGAFDVETIGVRYTPEKGGNADDVIGFEETALLDAVARSDYLVLACPLTDTTEGLVDEEVFLTLPTDAMVVNVARGPVVDTDALVAALRGNDIGSAALDVTDPEPLPADHPLWGLSNCLVTPHNAGHTPEYWNRCADILRDAANDAGLDYGQ
ncbi:phosphoglycerate dehydrogenase-like enzyme [Halarchaeum rubridurum]|uniref:Phosphoglycerate dehydrogenase n=1 Tax=Halarchaeum rubridurum TaxID=489911 RepID=A0A830FXF9_9EURY|nr:D-2-hydroxyacid dehydrogenase [Halarchaeum rubridurum]MBP1954771.1 phosphoglycerate dehydrogenase-like enzyme [Halarchaeum rubridurum]GGM59652.1 phosphoglycerate dehydrogenase [Halarchaeum rubridurum]